MATTTTTNITTFSRCRQHDPVQVGDCWGYVGSVARHPYTVENRAAHGGITYREECRRCGAQRLVNSTGWHYEYGPWGPTRAERRRQAEAAAARVEQLRARLRGRVVTVPFGDGTLTIQIDADGYLSVDGPLRLSGGEEERAAVMASGLVQPAAELRRAIIAWRHLADAV